MDEKLAFGESSVQSEGALPSNTNDFTRLMSLKTDIGTSETPQGSSFTDEIRAQGTTTTMLHHSEKTAEMLLEEYSKSFIQNVASETLQEYNNENSASGKCTTSGSIPSIERSGTSEVKNKTVGNSTIAKENSTSTPVLDIDKECAPSSSYPSSENSQEVSQEVTSFFIGDERVSEEELRRMIQEGNVRIIVQNTGELGEETSQIELIQGTDPNPVMDEIIALALADAGIEVEEPVASGDLGGNTGSTPFTQAIGVTETQGIPVTEAQGSVQAPSPTQSPSLIQTPGITESPTITPTPGLMQVSGLMQTQGFPHAPEFVNSESKDQMPGSTELVTNYVPDGFQITKDFQSSNNISSGSLAEPGYNRTHIRMPVKPILNQEKGLDKINKESSLSTSWKDVLFFEGKAKDTSIETKIQQNAPAEVGKMDPLLSDKAPLGAEGSESISEGVSDVVMVDGDTDLKGDSMMMVSGSEKAVCEDSRTAGVMWSAQSNATALAGDNTSIQTNASMLGGSKSVLEVDEVKMVEGKAVGERWDPLIVGGEMAGTDNSDLKVHIANDTQIARDSSAKNTVIDLPQREMAKNDVKTPVCSDSKVVGSEDKMNSERMKMGESIMDGKQAILGNSEAGKLGAVSSSEVKEMDVDRPSNLNSDLKSSSVKTPDETMVNTKDKISKGKEGQMSSVTGSCRGEEMDVDVPGCTISDQKMGSLTKVQLESKKTYQQTNVKRLVNEKFKSNDLKLKTVIDSSKLIQVQSSIFARPEDRLLDKSSEGTVTVVKGLDQRQGENGREELSQTQTVSTVAEVKDPNSGAVSVDNMKNDKHVCKVCGSVFGFFGDLKKHERSHHGNMSSLLNNANHHCPLCEETFLKLSDLLLHKKDHEDRPYSCQFCTRRFARQSAVKFHEKWHKEHETPLNLNEEEESSDEDQEGEGDKGMDVADRSISNEVEARPFEKPLAIKLAAKKPAATKPTPRKSPPKRKLLEKGLGKNMLPQTDLYDEQIGEIPQDGPENEMECGICGMIFKSKRSRLHHENLMHKLIPNLNGANSHSCKVFKSKSHRLLHENISHKTVSQTSDNTCFVCKKVFAHRRSCIRHQSKFHKDVIPSKIPSMFSKATEKDKIRLERDKGPNIKNGIKKGKGPGKSNRVNKDNGSVEKNGIKNPAQCPFCSWKFQLKQKFIAHMKRVHKFSGCSYRCRFCKDTFQTFEDKLRHEKEHRKNLEFVCKTCDSRFSSRKNLRRHEKKHIPASSLTGFRCNQCKRSFKTEEDLNLHVPLHEVKLLKCRFCKLEFESPLKMSKHEKSHELDLVHQCKFCKEVFRKAAELKGHEKSHDGPRPYKCSYCQMDFNRKFHLDRHERSHTGERIYACKYCKKRFATSYYRNMHEVTHDT